MLVSAGALAAGETVGSGNTGDTSSAVIKLLGGCWGRGGAGAFALPFALSISWGYSLTHRKRSLLHRAWLHTIVIDSDIWSKRMQHERNE